MSTAYQPIPERFIEEQKVRRILGFYPKSCEFNICGSAWALVKDYQGKSWWVNMQSERVLAASSQWPRTEGQEI